MKRTLLCAALGLYLAVAGDVRPVAAADPNQNASTIEVEAKRFSFSPDHITVKKGTTVTLKLHSADVTHGLTIKPFNVNTDIPKGKTTEVTFVPQQVGTFETKCSHFCGVGHGSMHFAVEVVP